ncbi:MAG TPA: excinuclease ABC subunit UvrC [Dongiaceae bacterium]|nr:excinuclease ABC subunit UvrC [Dongiaceae bacterium]
MSRIEEGIEVIRGQVRILPTAPGCYRMMNGHGDVLYVGKARDLRKRVAAYTQPNRMPHRLQRMIAETASMEFIQTDTEAEALLLEANLIKKFKPHFNVLLRDDKSFPYILLTAHPEAPMICKHRGPRGLPGEYFGPFASAGAVNRTLVALERAFLLRSCSDHVYEGRTRPCLQYQIKRCSAPCVGRIAPDAYAALVQQARDFLRGKSATIQKQLAAAMMEASEAKQFERAAQLRDRLQSLSLIQNQQSIHVSSIVDADLFAIYQEGGQSCIQVFFFRNHGNYGNRAYFPSHDRHTEAPEILGAFLAQFYAERTPPPHVLVNIEPEDRALLAEALSLRAGRRIMIARPLRGERRKPLEQAERNAKEALLRRSAESASQQKLLAALGDLFGMAATPQRIEVYDNSHIGGTHTYGVMIVAGSEGFLKNQYRKFSLRDATLTPGDDYGMMRHVLERRFGRGLREDPERRGAGWPDLVLIDGGQGQLNAARQVMTELGLHDISVVAIAKGPDRNAGRERFFLPDREPFSLDPRDPLFFFLQRLRDEAHRFAINAHRDKRSQRIFHSRLDEIPGVGAKRKKALLLHFGSMRAVGEAGLDDLIRTPGIDRATAQKIYAHFHESG